MIQLIVVYFLIFRNITPVFKIYNDVCMGLLAIGVKGRNCNRLYWRKIKFKRVINYEKIFWNRWYQRRSKQRTYSRYSTQIRYALGYYLKQKNNGKIKVIIGSDTRRSGYIQRSALTASLNSIGVDIDFVGVISTHSGGSYN